MSPAVQILGMQQILHTINLVAYYAYSMPGRALNRIKITLSTPRDTSR